MLLALAVFWLLTPNMGYKQGHIYLLRYMYQQRLVCSNNKWIFVVLAVEFF
jgi:hypothetical protein